MLKNIKIYQRLALAVALPLVLLTGLAAYDLTVKWAAREEMARLSPLVEGVARLSRLVHELYVFSTRREASLGIKYLHFLAIGKS